MGQEILNQGVKPHGTIWGATVLFHKKYHRIVVDVYLDFNKGGAKIIGSCCKVSPSHISKQKKLIM